MSNVQSSAVSSASHHPNHKTSFVDKWGTIASLACVVHCIATPILFSVFAVAAQIVPSEQHTHRVLAIPVCLLGLLAMRSGFKRHQRLGPALLMVVGLSLIVATAWWGELIPSHLAEVAITITGSAFMISAHRMNHKLCKACACHGHGHAH
jgi:hypothetical protein